METTVCEMEHNLKPVTNMIDTVKTSKENINTALLQLEEVCNGIKDTNQTIDVLKRKYVLKEEPHYYFETIQKAIQLIAYFNRDKVEIEVD